MAPRRCPRTDVRPHGFSVATAATGNRFAWPRASELDGSQLCPRTSARRTPARSRRHRRWLHAYHSGRRDGILSLMNPPLPSFPPPPGLKMMVTHGSLLVDPPGPPPEPTASAFDGAFAVVARDELRGNDITSNNDEAELCFLEKVRLSSLDVTEASLVRRSTVYTIKWHHSDQGAVVAFRADLDLLPEKTAPPRLLGICLPEAFEPSKQNAL